MTRKDINYIKAHVWIFYTITDNVLKEVDRQSAIKPNRTKVWKELQNNLSQYDGIGYCMNENFHAVAAKYKS